MNTKVKPDEVMAAREEARISIPWYKSPLYVSLVTSIISQLVAILGYQDIIDAPMVDGAVAFIFQIVALVAAGVAERSRRNSELQPLTLREKK